MKISSDFNKKYHAILNDVLSGGRDVFLSFDGYKYRMKTSNMNIGQIKYLFKFLDEAYPKSKLGNIKKVLSLKVEKFLICKYGFPVSMTEIDNHTMIKHIKRITRIAEMNEIKISDPEWERLLKAGDEYYG